MSNSPIFSEDDIATLFDIIESNDIETVNIDTSSSLTFSLVDLENMTFTKIMTTEDTDNYSFLIDENIASPSVPTFSEQESENLHNTEHSGVNNTPDFFQTSDVNHQNYGNESVFMGKDDIYITVIDDEISNESLSLNSCHMNAICPEEESFRYNFLKDGVTDIFWYVPTKDIIDDPKIDSQSLEVIVNNCDVLTDTLDDYHDSEAKENDEEQSAMFDESPTPTTESNYINPSTGFIADFQSLEASSIQILNPEFPPDLFVVVQEDDVESTSGSDTSDVAEVESIIETPAENIDMDDPLPENMETSNDQIEELENEASQNSGQDRFEIVNIPEDESSEEQSPGTPTENTDTEDSEAPILERMDTYNDQELANEINQNSNQNTSDSDSLSAPVLERMDNNSDRIEELVNEVNQNSDLDGDESRDLIENESSTEITSENIDTDSSLPERMENSNDPLEELVNETNGISLEENTDRDDSLLERMETNHDGIEGLGTEANQNSDLNTIESDDIEENESSTETLTENIVTDAPLPERMENSNDRVEELVNETNENSGPENSVGNGIPHANHSLLERLETDHDRIEEFVNEVNQNSDLDSADSDDIEENESRTDTTTETIDTDAPLPERMENSTDRVEELVNETNENSGSENSVGYGIPHANHSLLERLETDHDRIEEFVNEANQNSDLDSAENDDIEENESSTDTTTETIDTDTPLPEMMENSYDRVEELVNETNENSGLENSLGNGIPSTENIDTDHPLLGRMETHHDRIEELVNGANQNSDLESAENDDIEENESSTEIISENIDTDTPLQEMMENSYDRVEELVSETNGNSGLENSLGNGIPSTENIDTDHPLLERMETHHDRIEELVNEANQNSVLESAENDGIEENESSTEIISENIDTDSTLPERMENINDRVEELVNETNENSVGDRISHAKNIVRNDSLPERMETNHDRIEELGNEVNQNSDLNTSESDDIEENESNTETSTKNTEAPLAERMEDNNDRVEELVNETYENAGLDNAESNSRAKTSSEIPSQNYDTETPLLESMKTNNDRVVEIVSENIPNINKDLNIAGTSARENGISLLTESESADNIIDSRLHNVPCTTKTSDVQRIELSGEKNLKSTEVTCNSHNLINYNIVNDTTSLTTLGNNVCGQSSTQEVNKISEGKEKISDDATVTEILGHSFPGTSKGLQNNKDRFLGEQEAGPSTSSKKRKAENDDFSDESQKNKKPKENAEHVFDKTAEEFKKRRIQGSDVSPLLFLRTLSSDSSQSNSYYYGAPEVFYRHLERPPPTENMFYDPKPFEQNWMSREHNDRLHRMILRKRKSQNKKPEN